MLVGDGDRFIGYVAFIVDTIQQIEGLCDWNE
jgi:hypothetical protein